MPNVRHVVVRIEKTTTFIIVQILTPPTHDAHGIAIRDAHAGAHQRTTPTQRFAELGCRSWETRRRHTNKQIRVRRHASPHIASTRRANAREIAAKVQQIRDHLQMQMRCPVPILGGHTKRGNLLATGDMLPNAQRRKRCLTQVPIQCEKCRAVVQRMPQHNHSAIVQRLQMRLGHVHHTVQRRVHGSTSLGE